MSLSEAHASTHSTECVLSRHISVDCVPLACLGPEPPSSGGGVYKPTSKLLQKVSEEKEKSSLSNLLPTSKKPAVGPVNVWLLAPL